MSKKFPICLEQAVDIADVFEVVKEVVWKSIRKSRAGLNLGLVELGGQGNLFIGTFYPIGSNIILTNKTPLRRISETNYTLFKPYSFHILLHEYLHSLGYLDKGVVRQLNLRITEETMGEGHVTVEMAKDLSKYFPKLIYPTVGWRPSGTLMIEMVSGFDQSSINYIA